MTTFREYVRLQDRCRKILDDLGVPRSSSLESLVRWVEGMRGRPLVLKELPHQAAGAGACGLWLGTDAADFVFFEARTALVHREHIVRHELGHMLADHHAPRPNDGLGGGVEDLLTGLEPRLIKRLMARTSYTTAEEQEAEMLASLLHGDHQSTEVTGALGRLRTMLGMRADDRS
ncbi:regulator component [Streptomyces sp. RFCAC02]|uniref:regulator component n=1 Tax=Streptomyces sp. RFCAC02 TaxID=2499143 RepID=UPI00101FD8A5|nr:regulator component [Streptomyces sp. RFCAC02]